MRRRVWAAPGGRGGEWCSLPFTSPGVSCRSFISCPLELVECSQKKRFVREKRERGKERYQIRCNRLRKLFLIISKLGVDG
jgi:hypothetical protein